MADEQTRLEQQALIQACELGHRIAPIVWDTAMNEGMGTCTRCGDGVLLYLGPDGPSIQGTAFTAECPGNTCEHGWRVVHAPEGGVRLRCLHCGAERTEEAD